jgi:hypothetical protein
MTEAITYSLVHGFAVYSLIGLLVNLFLSKNNRQKAARFDYSACQIGALAGFIYLALSAMPILSLGRYSIPIWIHLLLLLSVQLLWFGKLYTIKWLRLLIAAMLLFSVEGWLMMITSMHRDYLPSTWRFPFWTQVQIFITDLLLFSAIATLFHWIKSLFKPKSIPQ